MLLVLRIVFGATFGFVALFCLFFGTLALLKNPAAGGVTLGVGAIAGAVMLYIASPRKAKAKKRARRPVAIPGGEPEERPLRRQEPVEGFARYFDMRTWDFDLAKVTPAGWVFGLASVAGIFALLGFLIWLAAPPMLDLPRWVIKVFGPVLLAPVTAYFIFGARIMKKLGYPVFREKKSPTKAAGGSGPPRVRMAPPGGLPPRRPPGGGR